MVTMCLQGLHQCIQVPCHHHRKWQAWHPSCPSGAPASLTTRVLRRTLAREGILPTISALAPREETEQDPSQADLTQLMWGDCCQYKREVKGLKSLKNQKDTEGLVPMAVPVRWRPIWGTARISAMGPATQTYTDLRLNTTMDPARLCWTLLVNFCPQSCALCHHNQTALSP